MLNIIKGIMTISLACLLYSGVALADSSSNSSSPCTSCVCATSQNQATSTNPEVKSGVIEEEDVGT